MSVSDNLNLNRLDHADFDLHFENTIFLTNEHIKLSQLINDNAAFYLKFLFNRAQLVEAQGST